jgi:transposase InsO family protein
LQQEVAGTTPRPLAFFSAKLSAAQVKYSAFDRELLSCYLAIKHFRWILEGREFYVQTDHKPLTFAVHRVSDALTARQQRQLSFVAEYTSDIRHVAGKSNVVADALSRPAAAISAPSSADINFEELAVQQRACTETADLARDSALKIVHVEMGGQKLLCDTSTGVLRPLVPKQLRKTVFLAIHELAHPGTRATRRLVSSRFVWAGCAADVARWCRECTACARGKVTVHVKTAVEPIRVPEARFQHVHVDIVGPLPVSAKGHMYVLTMIDRASRWPEAVPMTSITAEVCADTFAEAWVARFGVPTTVTTDRGTQFTSATWTCMAKKLGFRHVLTTSYHPQANGMVERLHRQLKEGLRARQCGTAWIEHLPWVLLGIRATPKDDVGISAAEVVYGAQMVVPGQLLEKAEGGEHVTWPGSIPLRARSYAEAARGPIQKLAAATYVFVKRGPAVGPLSPSYDGPFLVVSRSEKVYQLKIGDKIESVSADRLKPYDGQATPAEALPPRRGRPPGTGGVKQPPSDGAATGGGHM